jgi:hypothetical protein
MTMLLSVVAVSLAHALPPLQASFAFDATNLSAAGGLDPSLWFRCVGSGHAALSLRPDWRRDVSRARAELGFESIRFHGILNDDMGPVVVAPVASDGGYTYNFSGIDASFDWLVSAGIAPFVELSFMPSALAADPSATYLHYHAVVSPPADLQAWADFMQVPSHEGGWVGGWTHGWVDGWVGR